MRTLLLSLLLVLNVAWARPAPGGGPSGGGQQTQGDIVWPVGI